MIRKDLIFTDCDLKSKDEVLNLCFDQLEKLNLINDRTAFAEEIRKREETMPTAVGFGVAIPHGRCAAVNEAFIVFVRLKQAIVWDERQKDLPDMIFMIGVPESKEAGNLHLRILSQISRNLIHDDFREALRKADQEQAFELLNEIDQSIEGETK